MGRGLDWRWIGIGTAIMFGLNFLASLLVLPLIGGALPADPANPTAAIAGIGGGRLLLVSVISFLSFAVGGYIVATRSVGRTVVEPAISAALAVALGLLLAGAFTLGNLLAGGLVPFLAGLLGGWIGERRGRGAGVLPPRG